MACLLLGLAMQFPGTRAYYAPVAGAFWALATEKTWGHGPREAWIPLILMILMVYTCAAFLLICSITWLLKRLGGAGLG